MAAAALAHWEPGRAVTHRPSAALALHYSALFFPPSPSACTESPQPSASVSLSDMKEKQKKKKGRTWAEAARTVKATTLIAALVFFSAFQFFFLHKNKDNLKLCVRMRGRAWVCMYEFMTYGCNHLLPRPPVGRGIVSFKLTDCWSIGEWSSLELSA